MVEKNAWKCKDRWCPLCEKKRLKYDYFIKRYVCKNCGGKLTTDEMKAFNIHSYVPKEKKNRGKNKGWYEV